MATKKAVKEVVKEVEVVEEKKAARVKKTKAMFVQFQGAEFAIDDLQKRAEKAYKAAGNTAAIEDIKIYIKPEEAMAYYAINGDVTGAIEL